MMEEHYEKENPIILEILNYFLNNSKIQNQIEKSNVTHKNYFTTFLQIVDVANSY